MARSEQSRGVAARRKAQPSHSLGLPTNGLGRQGRARFRKFVRVALAWFAIVVFRLLDLQVFQGGDLTAKALRQQEATVDIIAKRGAIFDRHGNELALSTPAQSIGVFADRDPDKVALAGILAGAVTADESDLYRRLRRGGFQWVKRLATLAETERARALDLDSLHFETESKRYYPHGTVAAHVLGTVGLDHQGQAGLEQSFESRLRGEDGLGILQYDARQRRYGTQILDPSIPGDDIILHLDLNIQSLVHLELERAIRETNAQAGTIVLMRPDSGEVVAMSNWPRFDPNDLSRTPEDLEKLRNFAISYLVEPGSTFKVLTAAAALEEGLVTTEDVFDCEMGAIWIKRRRIRDHHPYGLLTMPEVLVKSSNVGIIKIGHRLGEQNLHKYIRQFGFGSATGVALPGEVHGLVRPLARWSSSSLASLSMGQEIGVSALQMARLFSAVANGGTLVKPRIVQGIREHGASEFEFEFEQDPGVRVISGETAATMQAILERVVESGTGRLAQIPGYRVAGKTGTAQMINPKSRSYADGVYLSSFCGFAPVNDPALVGVVMLYDPRGQFYYGGKIAAPLFSAVAKQALRHMDIPPSHSPPKDARPVPVVPDTVLADFVEGRVDDFVGAEFLAAAVVSVPDASVANLGGTPSVQPAKAPEAIVPGAPAETLRTAPDMRGLTMSEASSLAARLGIQLEFSGSGMANMQSPEPNEAMSEGQVLRLQFVMSLIAPEETGRPAEGGGG